MEEEPKEMIVPPSPSATTKPPMMTRFIKWDN